MIPKGTYYLWSSEPIKIRWSFIKAPNPSNYCKAKAKKLSSGKKETVVFNDNYEYPRWYKISLTKRKTITIIVTQMMF